MHSTLINSKALWKCWRMSLRQKDIVAQHRWMPISATVFAGIAIWTMFMTASVMNIIETWSWHLSELHLGSSSILVSSWGKCPLRYSMDGTRRIMVLLGTTCSSLSSLIFKIKILAEGKKMLGTFKLWVQMTPGQFLVCWCLLTGISCHLFQMHLLFHIVLPVFKS